MQPILQLLKLAIPMTVTRLGFLAFTLTDIIVVGQMVPDELAFQAAGVGPLGPPFLVGVGFLLAVTVLTAQAHGEGDKVKAQRYLRLGMIYALVLGGLCALLALFAQPILTILGFEEMVVIGATPIFQLIALSLLFQLLFTPPADFLEAIGHPRIVMATVIIANILNIGANVWLVGGGFGIPAMGAVGSAWATLIIRFFTFALIFGWLLAGPIGKIYNLSLKRIFVLDGLQHGAFVRIGLGSALALGIESSAFAAMLVFAGWMSNVELAGFNIAFNMLATVFMLSLGIGSAGAVLVGNAQGESNTAKARANGFLGLKLNTLLMTMLAIPCFFAASFVAGLFTHATDIVAIAIPLIAASGVIMIFDGGQVVASLIVRALGDTWMPTLIYLLCYGFIMIPLGYILGIYLDFRTPGLYGAVMISGIVSMGLMSWRFHHLTRNK